MSHYFKKFLLRLCLIETLFLIEQQPLKVSQRDLLERICKRVWTRAWRSKHYAQGKVRGFAKWGVGGCLSIRQEAAARRASRTVVPVMVPLRSCWSLFPAGACIWTLPVCHIASDVIVSETPQWWLVFSCGGSPGAFWKDFTAQRCSLHGCRQAELFCIDFRWLGIWFSDWKKRREMHRNF